MKLVMQVPTLTECGHTYIAGAGPGNQCLRLSRSASALWNSSRSDQGVRHLPDELDAIAAMLISSGAATAVTRS